MKQETLLMAVLFAAPHAVATEAELGITSIAFFETARLGAFCSEHLVRVPEPFAAAPL